MPGQDIHSRLVEAFDRPGQHSEANREGGQGGEQVICHLTRIKNGGARQRRGDRQRSPQYEVFKDCHSENQTRKSGIQDPEVGEYFRDYGNRSDRHTHREN